MTTVPMPSPRHALGRELQLATAGVVASRVVGAVGGVLLARFLGPADRGDVATAVAAGSFAGTAATLGLQFWIIPTVARGASDDVRRVLGGHLARTVAVAVASVAVVLLVADGPARWVWSATAAYVVAWVASMLVLAVANGERRAGAVAAATAGGSVAYVAGLVALRLTGHLTVATAVLLAAVANAVAVPVLWRRVRSLPARSGASGSAYAAAVRTGFPGALGELLLLAVFRVDLLIVAAVRSPADVGRYAVAVAVVEVLFVLPDALAQVLLPKLAGGSEAGGGGAGLASRLTLAGAAAAAVALGAVATPLVTAVFGGRYAPAAVALRWLLPGGVAIAVWKVVAAACVARGRTAARAWSAGAALVVLVAGDLAVVPRFGIAGAAAASTAAYVVAAAVVVRAWRRASREPLGALLLPRPADLGRAVAVLTQR